MTYVNCKSNQNGLVLIINLGKNLTKTVVDIKSDIHLEVLKNILDDSAINSNVSKEQKHC
ncbi:hypothetical protein [Spiroplasma endosymbiont of Polydrusus formosus]|uniref:hypothetical protein n=1 Tax=Spiroplasma endosymbiont of Polydrusus formosus TaxID=3139326 RepID=UPI0035B562BD